MKVELTYVSIFRLRVFHELFTIQVYFAFSKINLDLPPKYKGFENMISAYFNEDIGQENIHVLNIYVDKQLERLYLKKGRLMF